jgi:SPP1 gp7 family putative phage head morphogenesis protein
MANYKVIRNAFKNKVMEIMYREALQKQFTLFFSYIYRKNLNKLSFAQLQKELLKIDKNIKLLHGNTRSIYERYFLRTKRLYLNHQKKAFEGLRENLTITYNNPSYDKLLKISVSENASLITKTTTDTMEKIKYELYNNLKTNNRDFNYQKFLRENTDYTKQRIKLIARDQTAKLNGDINRLSQQEAGIQYWMWDTLKDERVSVGKGGHKQLQGKIYRWDEPENFPVIDSKGTKGIPSQRPNCRCYASPIVITNDHTSFKKLPDGSYKIV